jgi:hypothetical protein
MIFRWRSWKGEINAPTACLPTCLTWTTTFWREWARTRFGLEVFSAGATNDRFVESTNHRVGRVLSFFSVSPTPLAAGKCGAPPPFGPGGRAHSLAGEGLGESQFRRGDIHCGALYKYFVVQVLFAGPHLETRFGLVTIFGGNWR